MRVSEIELLTSNDSCLLQAKVSSTALSAPFTLWYRFPASAIPFVSVDSANPWVAALLMPAMKTGEPLEVSAPISPKMYRSLKQIQAIHRAWNPTLSKVEVKVPLRTHSPTIGKEVGLFFSTGIDSWYSLLKNDLERTLYADVVTLLIVVHGLDIEVGEWKKDVFAKMLANTQMIAEHLGKRTLWVATNASHLYTKLGVSWHWTQGGATASVALAVESMVEKFYIAAGRWPSCYLTPNSIHPLLDPLWSTECSTFVHDGCEASPLEKIRLVAQSELAMETLRVCWANHQPEFNCGHCSKCLRTMLGLYIAGALGKCRTLPPTIDPKLLRRVRLLFPFELNAFREVLNELGDSPLDTEIRAALTEGVAGAKVFFEHVENARRNIEALIPLSDRFILVDQDMIRFELSPGRQVIPFLEQDGLYYGLPKDDAKAVRELERLRGAGAKFMAFWREAFWWLEYYAGLNRHLRSNYPCILESDSLVVFDLRGAME